jgi:hypothetical protein
MIALYIGSILLNAFSIALTHYGDIAQKKMSGEIVLENLCPNNNYSCLLRKALYAVGPGCFYSR